MVPRSAAAAPVAAIALLLACAGTDLSPEADETRLPSVSAPLPKKSVTLYDAAETLPLPETAPEDHPSLHNVFHLSENIVSGSEPHGEEAFRILRSKGIRTILSVDGKVPDGELAEEYGMRYVHVPIQYRGITDDEVREISKSFRELEGPFYVHCFHGKHRGPAAAAIGRVVLDGVPRETAIGEMRQYCGTSSSYEGLYETVAYGEIPSEEETAAMDWDFPAASPLDGVAGSMVPIARHSDHLKALSRNEWRATSDHPDLDAGNESAVVAGLFERANDLEEVADQPEDFRGWMHDAMVQSAALRDAIRALRTGSGAMDAADDAYGRLAATCTACHEAYRN